VAEWIYFLHAPREDFAASMSDAESAAFAEHFEYLKSLFDDGTLILAGPTLGRHNTGLAIFEADSEEAARSVMEADPAISAGVVRGELRPYRVSLLRDRADR
jgi:uncharacterized protein YciI